MPVPAISTRTPSAEDFFHDLTFGLAVEIGELLRADGNHFRRQFGADYGRFFQFFIVERVGKLRQRKIVCRLIILGRTFGRVGQIARNIEEPQSFRRQPRGRPERLRRRRIVWRR